MANSQLNNAEAAIAKAKGQFESTAGGARGTSPAKTGFGTGRDGNAANQTEEWYKPELGDIPYAPLTKANREKIEKRDAEIVQKEKELEEIMRQISERKQERAEKEAAFRAQD